MVALRDGLDDPALHGGDGVGKQRHARFAILHGFVADLVSRSLDRLEEGEGDPRWSLPRKLSANVPFSPITAKAEESAFTATATSGGLKDVCVTQLTVAAAVVPPDVSAVRT